ncbi:MAG TPA: type II toxin-antitoxin system PemK/MazF family toxin [Candidatus Kapabacteria bacterium]|nr:type II toxin-antitoxin system PemK/MazF family toxin [Candidatus Kapabacteria bacterium]
MIETQNPERGEIWLINFEPSVGSEMKKIRPALVISRAARGLLPLRIVVPFTDWKPYYDSFEWFAKVPPSRLNGLTKQSGADCFQCKSVSLERFMHKTGSISEKQIEDIVQRIRFCIE